MMTSDQKREYNAGATEGRKDGASRYGMRDQSNMREYFAMGYRDGYYSTRSL